MDFINLIIDSMDACNMSAMLYNLALFMAVGFGLTVALLFRVNF